ncbi:MAG TPA: membrane protein insertase YidC [Bacteroidota bacterium]|nr:membrane protein insertase YidC [Bacteroidota bacterium]
MDRQAIIGFVLIAIIFIVWMFMMAPDPAQQQPQAKKDTTTQKVEETKVQAPPASAPDMASGQRDSLAADGNTMRFGRWFGPLASGTPSRYIVETEQYIAEFNTHGGSIARWTLKEFRTWDDRALQLIDWKRPSDFNLVFASSDGRFIDTKDLYFQIRGINGHKAVLKGKDSLVIEATLPVRGDSSYILKRYILRGSGYAIDMDVDVVGMSGIIANNEYQLTIHSPALTERNSVEEASFSEAHAFVDDSRQYVDATDKDEKSKLDQPGDAKWISVNNKYFTSVVMARGDFVGSGAYIEGISKRLPNEGERELYEVAFKVKYRGQEKESAAFTLFMGPMDYDILKEQYPGLEQTMHLGWAFVVRPFSEYLVMPLFSFLHGFIPNFGIVIIIFSILIKLLLHPLTKSSMKSMQRMQKLQPMINELREKYKDDQQKQNVEMMKLYKEYGVNPAGGCLPMLLQMPILFALFSIFRSIIDIRQEPFFGWIDDLSGPDILIALPFKIPMLGMSFISGLALLMAVTMFIQQKMSVKDPRQKSMIYMMPVMFWIMFNSFPSGLNLYYFMFNLLSIGQQWYINKRHEDEPLVKVVPKDGKKKTSWTERAMANLQEKAKQQQKGGKTKKF